MPRTIPLLRRHRGPRVGVVMPVYNHMPYLPLCENLICRAPACATCPRTGAWTGERAPARHAVGSLPVFVDDGNVLAPDYLAEPLGIERERLGLGVWGGSIVLDFDVRPARISTTIYSGCWLSDGTQNYP
jgi:hypothetical protein